MIKNRFFGFILFCCFAWGSNPNIAEGVTLKNFYLPSLGTKIHRGDEDRDIAGMPLGVSWEIHGTQNMAQCDSPEDKCISQISMGGGRIVPGVYYTEDGMRFAVFETTVPGIGYSLLVRRKGESIYRALTYPSTTNVLYDAQYESDRLSGFDAEAKVVFVFTGRPMRAGTFTIPTSTLGNMLFSYYESGIRKGSYIWLGFYGLTVTTTVKSCDISGAKTISMSDIPVSRFPTVGSSVKGGRLDLTLQCSQMVSISAVMTDQSNTANTSNILSLTSSSTAKGIGIRFYTDKLNGPIAFGPDSKNAGTQNQWYIGRAYVDGQKLTVPLSAEYVRTGPITIGSANGLASITFSYN